MKGEGAGKGAGGTVMSRRDCIRWLGGTLLAALVPSGTHAAGAGGPGPQRKAPPTGLVTDPIFKKHLTGRWHPESPARCDAILKGLKAGGLDGKLVRLKLRTAVRDEITLCHTEDYIRLVKRDVAAERLRLSTGDTPLCPATFEVALWSAGGALAAVDAVMQGTAKNAFCALRPPGHHADARSGRGFCVFNNIALAARYAQKKYRVGKVLIFDWDVHHGNGTQDIFYEDGSVFFCSVHQWPWYPGSGAADETGRGAGKGTTLNLPVRFGSGAKEILPLLTDKLIPAAHTFKPELVLISAGFDSRQGDPLGRLTLRDEDFAEMTQMVSSIAQAHAGGRVISTLEGGYELKGLASAAAAHVQALHAA